ncbi:ornithine cyclodeaminase family protein [Streptomyces sp. Je 1-4]|uniref:ornithine cyclodeaminase family protein n=1 Tax=Streptomyces TaxID=1883 RepID=UPI00140EBFF0|nr:MULTISPECIES: ornithine cyclodeaminase family protein [unclassified Streptomyces]QIK04927.1 ornithine cyclodeaminase family protein [Streptomyces sp. ID38640]UYB38094.1 ornithine cyclodeaminase family protein [Streptomyces sp. Je 1-4]UZQ34031.1 ornithine cyclodeaminase family protein [Streptomyces sp. Je 1-4] [Streptomyces sp. Je 1-4 4N24]UZQ41449.1 ornithine cyclodeaminase family protein [Streptomyces sp. Je 1-4] [Streptomyces sp. Je 1-4 4N24_ara]
MLVLGRSQVEALLDLDALIDALASAMTDLSAGRASAPDRVAALVPERDGFLAAMPGFVPSAGVLMSKLVSVFPHNGGTPVPTHQALIVAFDPHTGEPTALLDGTAITAARTAAGSALSARLLAREDASVLAVLGTGAQARSHAQAMCRVRPIRQIRVAGRDRAKATALADELSAALQVPVEAAATYAEALDGADIAAAATHAVDPVIRRSWLTPGVHVTSVGFNPAGREVDDATVAEALVCVESRQAALAPFPAGSNDLLSPLRDGIIKEGHVHAELGELLAGSSPGRSSEEQITLYKSVGVAVQDAAAAALVVAAARERSVGAEIRLE